MSDYGLNLSGVSTDNPTPADARRWRRHLADERATATAIRVLAETVKTDDERAILLELADDESQHADYWADLLGRSATPVPGPRLRYRVVKEMSKRGDGVWGSILLQRMEDASTYGQDPDATPQMAADEELHTEVLRGLAARGRERLSGNFRAAVFGANDGLVSNLALVVGMSATGVSSGVVLAAGVAGLLAGALSMAAGEYISVRSARELLDASGPGAAYTSAIAAGDVSAPNVSLIYRARGVGTGDADSEAQEALEPSDAPVAPPPSNHDVVGQAWGAASSSFCFFASGALIPVLPYLFGLTGAAALFTAIVLVGLALLTTGAVVGLLSGAPTLPRALRQLSIGYAAATATYLLGLAFDAAGVG